MESKKLIVTASPHITNHTSTRGLMLNVCIALLPALVASTLIFGARALLVTGVTVAACVGFEALYCVVMKKPVPVGDFSAVVTGMILAFNLPATIPLWIAIIGAFVAIVVAKQLFGGLGFNFANPALLGRIVLFIGFAGRMTAYAFPQTDIDALATSVTWPIYTYLLEPNGMAYLQTIVFILIIAVLVQLVEIILKKFMPPLYKALGVYLPLITTNCAVLGVTISVLDEGYNFAESLVCAVGAGVGFMVAMVLFSGVRKRLEDAQPPKCFEGLPITLVAASVTSLSFMGFGGVIENIFAGH